MRNSRFTESEVEDALLVWVSGLGYEVLHGPEIAPGEPEAERASFQEPFLPGRLREALKRLNPAAPGEALDEAFRKVTRPGSVSLVQNNRAFHRMLAEGVDVEYRKDGRVIHDKARLADFRDPDRNDWAAVNQFTVLEGSHNRRPDVVVFLNGLPVAVVELKNPADENATIWTALRQLETYKQQIPALFAFNELMIISDGLEARMGSLTADGERFLPWKTVSGEDLAPKAMPQIEVLVKGLFDKGRLLDLLRGFIVFEEDRDGSVAKKIAGYHQFHAVKTAVEETLRAWGRPPGTASAVGEPPLGVYRAAGLKETSKPGDRRIGLVWHTQGSGKSLTMAFYAGRIIQEPDLENPTVLVITDRNDLDDQLFGTFSRCRELLRQSPAQARDRAHLRELLQVAAGGVVFATIQKFLPEEKGDVFPKLSDRRNIVVIADEAHRSQYDFIDGFARHMRDALPNASFIGFTGTPIELTDKSTRAVFGDYISVYDIQRAVEDGATVPIYYESRLAKLKFSEAERSFLDLEFEEITEDEEAERKERLKSKWAALEGLVGAEDRIGLIAKDMAAHFEERQKVLEGKAMFVCMSRRICVDLYAALARIKPEWHDPDDKKGALKLVMTGSASDPLPWQGHIRSKTAREDLAKRFKDPKDPFKIVIVRDMWLTGFDAPCLHTMYLDKPMRGHGLMQAIARVNRVFKDKKGGLVVDYLGLADNLKRALGAYTAGGGQGRTAIDQAEAVALMLEKHEICRGLFDGFDWSSWKGPTASEDRLRLLPPAQQHILALEDGKARLLKAAKDLWQAFALAVPHEKTREIRDDVGFFQAVRAALIKTGARDLGTEEDLEQAVRQLVSKAVSSSQIVDIFEAAGLKKPNISILSDEFLAEVREMPHQNLAVELLRKLLKEEIKLRSRRNVVQGKSFAERLEAALRSYHNRAVETVQVLTELIALAKDMREAEKRGERLGLGFEEAAFYDALETSDSAVSVLGDKKLRDIARELVENVRRNASIDWTMKESVRARLRVTVKKILRRHGYPPDKQEKAASTVLEQAELFAQSTAVEAA
ncbi:MAG: type I restriction endonuclease subunit R [Elusimicrobia bacterium]|nr:type I restriction endonuclease subunit R [Elusimicrobiota bacterium]